MPKWASECAISVRNNGLRHPMNLVHIIQEGLSHLSSSNGCDSCMKCPILEKLSITTNIQSLSPDFGRPSIKSMDRSSQTCWGIGRGCNRPPGKQLPDFSLWQILQAATYSLISFFMWGQTKNYEIFLKVASWPEWPPYALSWHSHKICSLICPGTWPLIKQR